MRPDEMLGAAEATAEVVDLVTGTARDTHLAVADRSFRAVARGVGPAVAPVRFLHDRIAAAVYGTVRRTLTGAVRAVGRVSATLGGGRAASIVDRPRGGVVVGALNGAVGDRLEAQGNALALGLGLRDDRGRDVPVEAAALVEAYPAATGRLAVFLHGLCETEGIWRLGAAAWHPVAPPTHGGRLRADLGYTPVWVRYNSGRRISSNAADLDRLLEAVVGRWPVPVEEVALIGHSMGGLVVRGAAAIGDRRDAAWTRRRVHVVCLGTPHHGAPLEKLANVGAWTLGVAAESRAFATFLNRRSVGIKDLRYGNIADADWIDHDPDEVLRDTRGDAGLVEGVRYTVIAARVTPGPLGAVVGDLLVRLDSATGRHRRRGIGFREAIELTGLHHFSLLNHPEVYERLREALAAPPGGDAPPTSAFAATAAGGGG